MCACVNYRIHIHIGVQGGYRGRLNPLGLELQVVVGHPVWVLGPKLRFSARAVSTLNCGAISPAPWLKFVVYQKFNLIQVFC